MKSKCVFTLFPFYPLNKARIHTPNFLISILLFALIMVGCSRPKGFTKEKILSKHAYNAQWNTFPMHQEEAKQIQSILKQRFAYLSSGNHCYVFESEDHNYVIKFFKQNHMRTHSLCNYLPPFIRHLLKREEKNKRRQKERETSFTSYKIAYEYLKEETGVLYLHLNKTTHLRQTLKLIDQHNHFITLEADKMEFLIQKKALVGYKQIAIFLENKQEHEAFKAIESLLQIMIKRHRHGLFDCDLQIFKNFGFIGTQAIEIDVGEFQIDPTQALSYKIIENLSETAQQIIEWVKQNYPTYLPLVTDKIQDVLQQID